MIEVREYCVYSLRQNDWTSPTFAWYEITRFIGDTVRIPFTNWTDKYEYYERTYVRGKYYD
jgi:hypothetical protein